MASYGDAETETMKSKRRRLLEAGVDVDADATHERLDALLNALHAGARIHCEGGTCTATQRLDDNRVARTTPGTFRREPREEERMDEKTLDEMTDQEVRALMGAMMRGAPAAPARTIEQVRADNRAWHERPPEERFAVVAGKLGTRR